METGSAATPRERQDAGAGHAHALAQAVDDLGHFPAWRDHLRIVEGTDRFIEFLDALIEGAKRKIFLVVDNLRVHHAKRVSAWLANKTDRIELVFLPPYAAESNPDEYLNRDFKTALRSSAVSRDAGELLAKATAFMQNLCTMPERVKAYFRHPSAAYAAQCI